MHKPPATLQISLNERPIGTLVRLVDETIVFAFDKQYESDQNRPILSLSYKGPMNTLVHGRAKTGTRLNPFFSNLLPEGHLRDYLARKLEIKSSREFYLLGGLGLDLPGAVTAIPLGDFPRSFVEASTSQDSEHMPTLRFSLAGVQLKFSAIAETKGTFTIPANGSGGGWIVKLPSEKLLQLPETEHSMLTLAQKVGIEVPEFKLIPTSVMQGLPTEFQKIIADSLAVKRFDRTANGGKIHMEDFAQVYGVYPKDKYEKAGYGHIGRVIWGECGEFSFCEFIRRLVFTVAIGNGDMHLKNWSLLYTNPQKALLSPAYDFVPTVSYIPGDSLALNLGGTKKFHEITSAEFIKMADFAKAPERLVSRVVEETVESVVSQWAGNRFDLFLPGTVRQDIDAHMKTLPLLRARRLTITKPVVGRSRSTNLTIATVECDPIIEEKTVIVETPTGRTIAIQAPERMEADLLLETAQTNLPSDFSEGVIRLFVGESLYRQWRRINFITIDKLPLSCVHVDESNWQGRIETLEGEYGIESWQKIVSAFQRDSMEEFDIAQADGSIRNLRARVQGISNIHRRENETSTKATVKLKIEDERTLLNPQEGVSPDL